MTISPDISLGSLITILVTIVGGLGFVWAMRSRLDVVDVKMEQLRREVRDMQSDLGVIKQVLETQVRNDMRLQQAEQFIAELRRQVDELRHGEGFILPLQPKKAAFGGT